MIAAVLGAGRMGAFHVETLHSLTEVSETRVFDIDPSRRTHDSIDAALEGADFAVIVTSSSTHAELIELCVGRGLPILCEKPIDIDLSITRAVGAKVEASGVKVQMGFQRRFDAAFDAVRQRIADGSLGQIHTFAMSTYDRTPPPLSYVAQSGGIFRDMHIHDFDIVRWLFGVEVVEVFATGSVLVDDGFAASGDVDTAGLLLRFANGMLGLIGGGRLNAAGYIARLDVFGSKDMAEVREDRPYRDFLDRYPDAYRAEISHFLKVVKGEAEPASTAHDALEALRLAEAADQSRRERRPVRLAEIP